jgi:dTDP-4-dehydrorhamnose 3,5-epimerase
LKVVATTLPGVLSIQPRVFADERGFLFESYNRRNLVREAGIDAEFVQDNHSRSNRGVIRGLHYQLVQAQGKLVRVVAGSAFDTAVDLRRSSPTFGRWYGCELSVANRTMLWIPPGFAHGFAALEDGTELIYKVTQYWSPQHERTIRWNDPEIGIAWPHCGPPILSTKDRAGSLLQHAEVFEA